MEAAAAKEFLLVETLAAEIADAVLEGLPVERVRVRVRKPDVELALPLTHTAAIVDRRR